MIGSTSVPSAMITREAFRGFAEWMETFSTSVREHAANLARRSDGPGVITSETLVEAVRRTCEQIILDVETSTMRCGSDGQENKKAA